MREVITGKIELYDDKAILKTIHFSYDTNKFIHGFIEISNNMVQDLNSGMTDIDDIKANITDVIALTDIEVKNLYVNMFTPSMSTRYKVSSRFVVDKEKVRLILTKINRNLKLSDIGII